MSKERALSAISPQFVVATCHRRMEAGHDLPWTLSFSLARAIQYLTLDIWAGKDRSRVTAQQTLEHLARCNCAALTGNDNALLETQ